MKTEKIRAAALRARAAVASSLRWMANHPDAALAVLVFAATVAIIGRDRCGGPVPSHAEAAAAARAGVLPADAAPKKDVRKAAEDLCEDGHNPKLCAKIAALEKELGRINAEFVVNAQTKPIRVKAPPRAESACSRPSGDPGKQERTFGWTPEDVGAEEPRVALYEGEQLVLKLRGVGLRSRKTGQMYLPATIGAYTPTGFELGTEVLDIPLSEATEKAPPARLGSPWEAGGGGGLSPGGWLLAGHVASPQRRLPLRVGVRGHLILAGGPGQGLILGTLTFGRTAE